MKRAHQQMQRKLARPVDQRRPWRHLADKALIAANQITGANFIAQTSIAPGLTDAAELQHLRRGMKAIDFPVEGVSARHAAEAFLAAVDAFALIARGSPHRSAVADLLDRATQLISALLEEQQLAEMKTSWQNRAGLND